MQASLGTTLDGYTIAGFYARELRGPAAAGNASVSSQEPPTTPLPSSKRPVVDALDGGQRMATSQEDPFLSTQNEDFAAKVKKIERKQEEQDPDYSNSPTSEKPKKRTGSESTPKSAKKARNKETPKETLQRYLMTPRSENKPSGSSSAARNSATSPTRPHAAGSRAAADAAIDLDAEAASPTPQGRGSDNNSSSRGTQERAANLMDALAQSQDERSADTPSQSSSLPIRRTTTRSISPPGKRYIPRQRSRVVVEDDDDDDDDDNNDHNNENDNSSNNNNDNDEDGADYQSNNSNNNNQDDRHGGTETPSALGHDEARVEALIARQLLRCDAASFDTLVQRIRSFRQAREELSDAMKNWEDKSAELEAELLSGAEGGYGGAIA